MSIYCLFVGINHYKANSIQNLGGCENDVSAIQAVLKERFNISDKNMLSLLNAKASRAAILENFDSHLGQAQEGDTALFYYSGHGSQERANQRFDRVNKGSHFNETLVCHDSRVNNDDYDLADKELRYLINKISKNKPRIITIIDSCHSGGASRGIEGGNINGSSSGNENGNENGYNEQVRQTPGSDATRPIESYVFYEKAVAEGWLDDMSQLHEGDHIEMSACRNTQLSKEKYVARTKYGVFTYYLQQTLKYTHDLPSYRNLNAIVSQKVQGTVSLQHPQVDAVGNTDINKLFLADKIEPAKTPLYFEDGDWWISVGLPQGINVNATLLITTDDEMDKACYAEVVGVLHDKSRIKISSSRSLNTLVLNTDRQYQAVITDPAMPKLLVHIKGDSKSDLKGNNEQINQLRDALEENMVLEESKAQEFAEYTIKAIDSSCYALKRNRGLPLVAPIASVKEVIQQANQMAYWKRTLNLAFSTGDLPHDSVKVVIKQLDRHSNRYSICDNTDNEINLNYQTIHGELKEPHLKISLELNTTLDLPDNKYFVSFLLLDQVTGLVKVLVNNENLINKTTTIYDDKSKTEENEIHVIPVKHRNQEVLQFSVNEKLLNQGIGKTTDYFKLFITNFENDMSAFEQTGFSSKDRTPACGGEEVGRRGMDDYIDEIPESIYRASTQTITLNTIRPLKSGYLSSDKNIEITDSIRILAHGMNADIHLEEDNNLSSGARGVDSIDTKQPDIFRNNPYTQPLSLIAHKGLDSAPTVIRIDLPETRSLDSVAVSKDKPLIIEVDQRLKDNEQILPYAQDGEFYIPLGYAKRIAGSDAPEGKTHIIINQLPEAVSEMGVGSEDEGRRSVGGSISIFFQKIAFELLKIEHDTTRLAIPEFATLDALSVDNYEDSEALLSEKVATANKILLFVHGILGDTKSMAGSINAKLPDGTSIRESYDIVLTFDYENLNTPIAETAEALIKKLAKLGLDGSHDKQLDIVAHSMGGLVSRWMIEKNPAAPKVNKLVMLGTPNGGSPFSDVKKWAFGTLTLALNGIALTGVTGLTISILGRLINSADETLDEMDKNSKTLAFLYDAKDPNIPYYLIAGDTKNLRNELESLLDNDTLGGDMLREKASRFSRFMAFLKERSKLAVADLFTDTLFGEANDIAVSRVSMQHIPEGRHHAMEVTEIDCDHTRYFIHEKSLVALGRILTKG